MDRCHQPEDVGRILDLPAEAPERRHLEQCPRCRMLARRYRAFLACDPLPAEADARDAGATLERRLADIIPLPLTAAAAGDAMDRPAPRRRPRRQWYALAAVLVLAVGFVALRGRFLDPEATPPASAPLWRGTAAELDAPRFESSIDGLVLTWPPVTGADRAVIVVLSGDLRVLAETVATHGTRHVFVDDDGHPALPAEARYVQIRFERGGAAVETSALLPLPAR